MLVWFGNWHQSSFDENSSEAVQQFFGRVLISISAIASLPVQDSSDTLLARAGWISFIPIPTGHCFISLHTPFLPFFLVKGLVSKDKTLHLKMS